MKQRSNEVVQHHTCPEHVAEQLRLAGGINRFGEPLFKVVWGYDRIVPIHGEWQEFEQFMVRITAVPRDVRPGIGEPEVLVPDELQKDIQAGYSQERLVTKLKRSIVETRLVPKYLPGNCWHLEMWRPPEEYGTPEQWKKAGEEVLGLMTIDTAGPYPSQGEYELCYPLTHDGSCDGQPIPLIPEAVTEIVRMIIVGRDRFTAQQRRAALMMEAERKDAGFVRITEDHLKDSLRPFAGEAFIVNP